MEWMKWITGRHEKTYKNDNGTPIYRRDTFVVLLLCHLWAASHKSLNMRWHQSIWGKRSNCSVKSTSLLDIDQLAVGNSSLLKRIKKKHRIERSSSPPNLNRSCSFATPNSSLLMPSDDLRLTAAFTSSMFRGFPPPVLGKPRMRWTVSLVIFSSLPGPMRRVMSFGSSFSISQQRCVRLPSASMVMSSMLKNPFLTTAWRCLLFIIWTQTRTSWGLHLMFSLCNRFKTTLYNNKKVNHLWNYGTSVISMQHKKWHVKTCVQLRHVVLNLWLLLVSNSKCHYIVSTNANLVLDHNLIVKCLPKKYLHKDGRCIISQIFIHT